MLRLSTRRGGWVDLITVGQASAPCRCIATASAIHRGLRRSKGAPEPSYGSRRGPRPTDGFEDSGKRSVRPKRDFDPGDRRDRSERPGSATKGLYDDARRLQNGDTARTRGISDRADTKDPFERPRSSARDGYDSSSRRGEFGESRAKPRADYGGAERKDRFERPRSSATEGYRSSSRSDEFGKSRAKPRADFNRADRNDRFSTRTSDRRSARTRDTGPDWDISDSSGFDGGDRQRKLYDRRDKESKSSERPFDRARGSKENGVEIEAEEERPARPVRTGYKAPITIPYTTPASEFLYGTSVVEAALRSTRRQLYKLYTMQGKSTDRAASNSRGKLVTIATKRNIPVEILQDQTTLLDKMSQGRPHNGVALEASPLKRPTVDCLLPLDVQDPNIFRFEAGPQSQEDRALHGSDNTLVLQTKQRRHPFVLMLDGVQDTGNMGGIIRTAHFLGVDAVVLSATCAPMNAIVLKASAGAAEQLPLLSVSNTSGFIERSSGNGWKFFASVAPPKKDGKIGPRGSGHISTHSMKSPLLDAPCVLMIGGEGTGLKADLVQKADRTVSIPSWRYGTSSVDSLNVSVATGVLANAFLSLPQDRERLSKTSTKSEEQKAEGEEKETTKLEETETKDEKNEESDRSLW